MSEFGIGRSVPRVEDGRFLTGQGRFVENISLPNQCHGYVLRSPHAHADILSIDVSRAQAAPGVLLVLNAQDYIEDNLGKLPYIYPLAPGWDLDKLHNPGRIALADGTVRFVGDAVAFIVAETLAQAEDAAELVEIDYLPRPCVVETEMATAPEMPLVWEDCPDNIMFEHEKGDRIATDKAFSEAKHIVSERLVISRATAATMESRAMIADYDAKADFHTIYVSAQSAFLMRRYLAENIFNQPQDKFRIVISDVGGSFGLKGAFFPEYALTVWASRRLRRPVRWICNRSDAFLSDYHGRDNISHAQLALDNEGNFLGVRVETTANLGAYPTTMPTGPCTSHVGGVAGVYTMPTGFVRITGVYTNTSPVGSYRGAGRPEACFVIERLIDNAARQLKMDRAELRRKNMIQPEALPYRTPFYFKFEEDEYGYFEYDSGDFPTVLEKALASANYTNFETRRNGALKNGLYRGFGLAYIIEMAASPGTEFAEIEIDREGFISLYAGTTNNGQGHQTTYTQVVCEMLGVEPADVRVIEGDTGLVKEGSGTSSSRTSTMGGSATYLAAKKIIEKGKLIAANLLGCEIREIDFDNAQFLWPDKKQSVSLKEVARAAHDLDQAQTGLCESATHKSLAPNWPNGCHLCEVEIDPDTGIIEMIGYWVVEDVGTVVNPMLLAGQVQGGIAQGWGQVVTEKVEYEKYSGQLVTGSFMDFCMPRAGVAESITISHHPVPTKTNPLGVKGGGESGTIGSLPCIMNAIVDALSPLGISNIDMPATPEKVYTAIRNALKQ
jgi:aerobic carbon-monoxide dehydrogenase large subunit